jgi:hypothetical protein
MNTGRTHFKPGNKAATVQKGGHKKKTLIKMKLAECLEEVDGLLGPMSKELLTDSNKQIRMFAWKELIKYRFPKEFKFEHTGKDGEPLINKILVEIVKQNDDSSLRATQ